MRRLLATMAALCAMAATERQPAIRKARLEDIPKAMPPPDHPLTLFKFHTFEFDSNTTIEWPIDGEPTTRRLRFSYKFDHIHYDLDSNGIVRFEMLECHEGECADVERRRPHFVHVRLGTQVVRGFFVNATVEAPPRWSALLGVVFGLHTVADGVEMNVWQRAQTPHGHCFVKHERKNETRNARHIRDCDFALLSNRTTLGGGSSVSGSRYEARIEFSLASARDSAPQLFWGEETLETSSTQHSAHGVRVSSVFRSHLTSAESTLGARFCNGTLMSERCGEALGLRSLGGSWSQFVRNMDIERRSRPDGDDEEVAMIVESATENECAAALASVCVAETSETAIAFLAHCRTFTAKDARRLVALVNNACATPNDEALAIRALELLLGHVYPRQRLVGTLLLRAEHELAVRRPRVCAHLHSLERAMLGQWSAEVADAWRQLRRFKVFRRDYNSHALRPAASRFSLDVASLGALHFSWRAIATADGCERRFEVASERRRATPLIVVRQSPDGAVELRVLDETRRAIADHKQLELQTNALIERIDGSLPLIAGPLVHLRSGSRLRTRLTSVGGAAFALDIELNVEGAATVLPRSNPHTSTLTIQTTISVDEDGRISIGPISRRQKNLHERRGRTRQLALPGACLVAPSN